jgi:hypothetical protein
MRSTLFILSFAAGLAVMAAQTSAADEPTYEQIVVAVLKESRAAYARGGERGICPYDRAADGRLCGKRSLYKKAADGRRFAIRQT